MSPMICRLFALVLAIFPVGAGETGSESIGSSAASGFFPGVNLAGAEFGGGGKLFKTYIYPRDNEFVYYQSKGMRIIRLPFTWGRVQPALRGDLDPENVAQIDRCVEKATGLGMCIILDVHSYGMRYVDGKKYVLGRDPQVSGEDFNDLWVRLANRYKGKAMVWFGLMNEPHAQSAVLNASIMQAAVVAIRGAGAKNMILVPGTAWTGAHSWVRSGNADAMEGFTDPANNFCFEVHQYLDKDSSGTHPDAVPGAGTTRLAAFTTWARARKVKGFLGEFGWDKDPKNTQAPIEGEAITSYVAKNKDVWLGYTYWAGGPWWPSSYMFTIEPSGLKENQPVDRPQMEILRKYLQ